MMSRVVESLMWSAALLLLFAVSHVMLQCDSGTMFRAHCTTVRRRILLLYESEAAETVECRNVDPGGSYTWTLSPDGTKGASMALPALSDRYTIDGRSLVIELNNITGEDGGLYRCMYSDNSVTEELCIEVHERAVFESCPSEYMRGCTENTQVLAISGGSAVFDASVMYTPGGSCDFQQMIERVMLWRINRDFEVPDSLIFSCSTTEGAQCYVNDTRVSLSRGDKPGLQFRFTLSSTQLSDNSSYRVIVIRRHPRTGAEMGLMKNFDLRVDPAPTSATSLPTGSATTPLGNDDSVSASSGGSNSGAVVAGVLVPLLVVVLVVVLLGLLFLIVRWKQGYPPSPSHLYKKKTSGEQKKTVKMNSNGVDIADHSPGSGQVTNPNSIMVTTVRHTEVQPLGNVPNILINIENSVEVSLPPENTRMSFIDSDMHELPLRLQELQNLPLRAQSIPVKTLESPGVPV